MTADTALSIEQKRIAAKKKLALQKLRQNANPKPVSYVPPKSGNDSIYIEKTGETIQAPTGAGKFLSDVQNDPTFDTPSTAFEEAGARFEAQAAGLVFIANALGMVEDKDAAPHIADRNKALASAIRRRPEYVNRFNQQWENAKGFFEGTGVLLSNGQAIGREIITNAPNAVGPLALGAGGAVIGTAAGPVGTVAGLGAGTFVGGSIVEVGAEIDSYVQQAGYDTSDANQVLAALQNDELMRDISIMATKKGITTAAVDTIMQVVGGRFLKMAKVKGAGKVGQAAGFGADIAVESVGETAGEAAGRFAAEGRVDWKDAILEGITSLGQSTAQAAIAGGVQTAKVGGERAISAATNKIIQERQRRLDDISRAVEGIDINEVTIEEIDNISEQFDIAEVDRDQISAIAEQQIMETEQQEQVAIVEQARQIYEQIQEIPEVSRETPSTLRKEMGVTPQSVTEVIKKKGGVEGIEDAISTRGIDGRTIRTISGINKTEQMKQILFDEGFFADRADASEITDNDLFDAIANDLKGQRVFKTKDEAAIVPILEQAVPMTELERRGITRNMSINDIANVLRSEIGLPPFSTTPVNKTEQMVAQGAITKEYKQETQKMTSNRLGRISGQLIPSFYDSRRRRKRIQSNGRNFMRDFATGIEKAITPMSTRIKNISPELFVRLRRFEFEMKRDIVANNKQLEPFLQSLKMLTNEDFTALDFALKNGKEDVIDQISQKYGIQNEVQEVRNMLDDIYKRATDVGMDINYRSTFFPRRVADIDGLMDYIRGTDAWNIVKAVIDAREERLGRPLTDVEKSSVVNNLFRGFTVENISLSKKGIFKERTIEEVTSEIDQFYETSDQALIKYVVSANEAIAASKLFGKGLAIDDATDIDDSIGATIADLAERRGLSSRDARALKDMLSARFNEKTMGYILSGFRNLTYIDVMGSPLNAITQIGDLTTSMYNAGILNAVMEIPKSITEKGQISLDDIGINQIAHEFETGSFTSKGVNNVFKAIGLQKIDRIGKLNLINSSLKKFQNQAKKNDIELKKRLDIMFGINADQVMQDLADGNITEDVKFLAFNVLLDMQPVAQSEMPEYYLRTGNLKILYMLKTFTIKQADLYRREVASELRQAYVTGNKKQAVMAMGNFIRLASFWMTMGATADFMKDFIRSLFGDDEYEEPEDYLIDNLLKSFAFSRYQLNMVGKKGITQVFYDFFLPPTKFIDNIEKDFKRILKDDELTFENSRAIRSIPIGGELYYFWFGAGSGGENTSSRRSDL